MILYLVEFFILHTLFFLVYKVLLAKETQLSFLRFFLLGSTVLSLIAPAVKLPNTMELPVIHLEEIVLSESFTVSSNLYSEMQLPWYAWIIGAISILIAFRIGFNLFQIRSWYLFSEPGHSFGLPVRIVNGLKNSFSFFRWIFINPSHFEREEEVIRHEWGHAKYLHSLDILFFNLLTICFWWVPSIWLMLRELRKVHEFQADQYALSSTNSDTYIKTLVHSTLRAHGLNLASSFDDAPIVTRLNFIKMMKKKISPWKLGSILAIVLISGALFACEEEINDEIGKITEESNQAMAYSDQVQEALANAQQKYPDVKFAVVETLIDNEKKLLEMAKYQPEQIESMFVEEDEDGKKVVLIVSEDSKLFKKSIEHQKQKGNGIFTIVEEPASFPGGTEALATYLSSNLVYPNQAKRLGVEGNVIMQFVVELDGSLSDVQVIRGIGAGCDAQAMKVLENSPKWIPGKQDGKDVRQVIIQKISFKLDS